MTPNSFSSSNYITAPVSETTDFGKTISTDSYPDFLAHANFYYLKPVGVRGIKFSPSVLTLIVQFPFFAALFTLHWRKFFEDYEVKKWDLNDPSFAIQFILLETFFD